MKKNSLMRWLAIYSALPGVAIGLPMTYEVRSGEAAFSYPDENTLVVEAQDHAIIQYQSFNILQAETVQFVQPSSSSVVLNRVVGQDPSQILGKMVSNGRVFLVNPQGVYFGKDANVDMGSLIASTLDIQDEDFIQDKWVFSRTGSAASVENLGNIAVQQEGFVAFLGSKVQNKGTVVAKAGSVILAAGEKVALDFVGNGLIQFVVEEPNRDLALLGEVFLDKTFAKQIIQDVINMDGVQEAGYLVEQDGIICLVEGTIDVSGEKAGGNILVAGASIIMDGAQLNASGDLAGGQVLVGTKDTKQVQMSPTSFIHADAKMQGDGGKVVLWSQGVTQFDGVISAKGGQIEGSGGFVETSGLQGLCALQGKVDTTATLGRVGSWLLDPLHIIVRSGGSNLLSQAQDCLDVTSTYIVDPSVINGAMSDVILCVSSVGDVGTIQVVDPIAMTYPGVGLTFSVDGIVGSIALNNSISTNGGVLQFEGAVVLGNNGSSLVLDTTAGGSNNTGADILFSKQVNGNNPCPIELFAGSKGEVSFASSVGTQSPIDSLTVTSASCCFAAGNIMTHASPVTINSPFVIQNHVKIDTTARGSFPLGSNISLKDNVDGNYRLVLDGGSTGTVFAGSGMGQNTALSVIQMRGSVIQISSNMKADGGTIVFDGDVLIGNDVALVDTGPTGVIFTKKVNSSGGAHSLTTSTPLGRTSFLGAVGDTGAFSSITVNSANVQIADDITTVASLTINGPVQLLGNSSIASAVIDFADTIDGSYDLTLDAAVITLSGQIGFLTGIGSLVFTQGNVDAQSIVAASITQSAGSGTFHEALISTSPAGITLTGVNFDFNAGIYCQNAGSFSCTASGLVIAEAGLNVVTSRTFTIGGTGDAHWQGILTTVGSDVNFNVPVTLTGDLTISTGAIGAGSLVFSDTVDGDYDLALETGTGDISFDAIIGGTTPLGNISIASARNVTMVDDLMAQSYTQAQGYGLGSFLGDITLTGALGLNVTSNYLHFPGALPGRTVTTTNGDQVYNAVFGNIGTIGSPVEVNIKSGFGNLFVGSGAPSYFSSSMHLVYSLASVRSNVPCFVDYNGIVFTPDTCPIVLP